MFPVGTIILVCSLPFLGGLFLTLVFYGQDLEGTPALKDGRFWILNTSGLIGNSLWVFGLDYLDLLESVEGYSKSTLGLLGLSGYVTGVLLPLVAGTLVIGYSACRERWGRNADSGLARVILSYWFYGWGNVKQTIKIPRRNFQRYKRLERHFENYVQTTYLASRHLAYCLIDLDKYLEEPTDRNRLTAVRSILRQIHSVTRPLLGLAGDAACDVNFMVAKPIPRCTDDDWAGLRFAWGDQNRYQCLLVRYANAQPKFGQQVRFALGVEPDGIDHDCLSLPGPPEAYRSGRNYVITRDDDEFAKSLPPQVASEITEYLTNQWYHSVISMPVLWENSNELLGVVNIETDVQLEAKRHKVLLSRFVDVMQPFLLSLPIAFYSSQT